jgi:hypothetical protein
MIRELFCLLGSHITIIKEHKTIFKGFVNLKIDYGLLYLPGDMLFMFKKLPNLRDSNQLPGILFSGES